MIPGITFGVLHRLLTKHGLLIESAGGIPAGTGFSKLSCDSRSVDGNTLFFVKGDNFREEYLARALDAGVKVYAAERLFKNMPARGVLVVSDVKKAMALAAAEFYGNPQEKLYLTAFTGTKGKTTAAYYTKYILDRAGLKAAMLSTAATTLDGVNYFKSELTTPESLDLFRMMYQAVQNGATHLIMEVSSQAYKTNRVYGLTFDTGVFLNISPDHIGPAEHPGFDDYFLCKRRLLHNSKTVILNRNSRYYDVLRAEAGNQEDTGGTKLYVFGTARTETDIYAEDSRAEGGRFAFTIKEGTLAGFSELAGAYTTRLAGNFNVENALAAAIAARLAGAAPADIAQGIAETLVPGRMEQLVRKNGSSVYIDYAHNGVSLEALLGVVKARHSGSIVVVIGATGNKGQSRRGDIGAVLGALAGAAVLTADDPAFEDPAAIAEEIRAAITRNIETHIIVDRIRAIRFAFDLARRPEDAVVIAGKGADCFQIVQNEKIPYQGDYAAAEKIIKEETADET
jgi:UDP-N-acetylmuramoyl-L-alanyl-D-glutamate-L-lysine ligase